MSINWFGLERDEATRRFYYPDVIDSEFYSDEALALIIERYLGTETFRAAETGFLRINSQRSVPLPVTNFAIALYLQDAFDVEIPTDPLAVFSDLETTRFRPTLPKADR